MRVRITQLLGQQPLGMVEFETEYGIGHGVWMNGHPMIASEYDIEFEIPDVLKWGTDLLGTAIEEIFLDTYKGYTYFYGKIEDIDDTTYIIRFGTSLLMVETDQRAAKIGHYAIFMVKSDRLLLHDTNL